MKTNDENWSLEEVKGRFNRDLSLASMEIVEEWFSSKKKSEAPQSIVGRGTPEIPYEGTSRKKDKS